MKIAYNPTTAAALTAAPSNNDITFDLKGVAIYAKGVKFKGTDTTYSVFKKHTASGNTGGYNGLVPVPSYTTTTDRFLREDGNWVIPTNTTYSVVSSTTNGLAPKIGTAAAATIATQADEWVLTSTKGGTPTWRKLPTNAFKNDNTNTTYTLSGGLSGNNYTVTLTPSSGNATIATIPAMTGATSSAAGKAGLVPAPAANKHTSFLRGDGTWATPSDTHYTTHLYIGAKDAASNAATTNGNTYIKITDNSTIRNQYIIKGSGITTVASDANGNITINTPVNHNLPTSDINKLTGYTIATSAAALTTTDTLNAALGKLEYKLNVAYDLVTKANDKDGTIENLKEILDVLAGIKDTETIKAIVGKYLPLAGGTLTGNLWFGAGNTDKYITFTSATTGTDAFNSWRIGYIGSGSGNGNHFVLQSTKATTNTWTNALSITNEELIATFASTVIAPTFLGRLAYTYLTGSGTTANQAIVSTGTANGWTLKTLGSRAFDSTAYLPLAGGTMTLGEGLKFHADENYFGTNSDARIISLLDGNGTTCDGGLIIDERCTSNGTTTVTELLRIRDTEFKWKGLNILHSGNSSVTKSGQTLTVTINGTSQSLTNSTYNFSGASFTSGNQNTAEHDANKITSNGVWYYTANGPATSLGASTNDGALYSLAYSTSWVGQIALDYRDGDLFTRGRNNGTWTTWKRVAYANDIPTSLKNPNALTLQAGAFTAKTYDGSAAVTVNIPTHTSHLVNNSGFLTLHLSLANYVTLNTAQTITGLKTFQSSSDTTGVSLILKNKNWYSNMATAMDFYNGGSYTVPNARIATKMVGSGSAGGTLIFYTLTKHASTNPNPNGLTERLRISDGGLTTVTGSLTVTSNCDFSAGTVKLDTLHIPTASGGTTYGAGTNGLILKSNGTTVYWASDNNSDTKVTLTVTTTSNTSWRPILVGYSYSDADPFAPSTVTDTVYATHLIKIKPSTGALWASSTITTSGFVKSGSSNSYVLLGGGGHKALSDFMLKSEILTNNLTTISKSLTVTQAWMDTGIRYTDLPATGTYIVLVYAHMTNNLVWYGYWSGLMSWYRDSTNSSESDEIILHRASHAMNGNTIYLRTSTTAASDGRHFRLLIAANKDLAAATYTFKFKRVI